MYAQSHYLINRNVGTYVHFKTSVLIDTMTHNTKDLKMNAGFGNNGH